MAWHTYLFLNSLKNGCFKSSLTEQKQTTLIDTFSKAVDFIGDFKIYVENSDVTE